MFEKKKKTKNASVELLVKSVPSVELLVKSKG